MSFWLGVRCEVDKSRAPRIIHELAIYLCDNISRRFQQESAMKTSTDRILTTHIGSLPRPARLMEASANRDKDPGAFVIRAFPLP